MRAGACLRCRRAEVVPRNSPQSTFRGLTSVRRPRTPRAHHFFTVSGKISRNRYASKWNRWLSEPGAGSVVGVRRRRRYLTSSAGVGRHAARCRSTTTAYESGSANSRLLLAPLGAPEHSPLTCKQCRQPATCRTYGANGDEWICSCGSERARPRTTRNPFTGGCVAPCGADQNVGRQGLRRAVRLLSRRRVADRCRV